MRPRGCCRQFPHIICEGRWTIKGICGDDKDGCGQTFCSYAHWHDHMIKEHGFTEEELEPFGLHTPYPNWWPQYREVGENSANPE